MTSNTVPAARPAIAPDETINAIVARHPQALSVLASFGLDTCCGGALPLATAVQHHELNLRQVLAALNEAAASAQ